MTSTVEIRFIAQGPMCLELLRKMASSTKDPRVCYEFALALQETHDEANYKEMFENLKLAFLGGIADATSNLGDCYFYGIGTEKNPKKGVELYICSAEMGSLKGCFSAGNELLLGKYVKPDYPQAYSYLKKAADNGDERAINSLAIMYLYGFFVEQNWKTAKRLFRKSAKLGD